MRYHRLDGDQKAETWKLLAPSRAAEMPKITIKAATRPAADEARDARGLNHDRAFVKFTGDYACITVLILCCATMLAPRVMRRA